MASIADSNLSAFILALCDADLVWWLGILPPFTNTVAEPPAAAALADPATALTMAEPLCAAVMAPPAGNVAVWNMQMQQQQQKLLMLVLQDLLSPLAVDLADSLLQQWQKLLLPCSSLPCRHVDPCY